MKFFLWQNKQPAQMQVKSITYASSTHLCFWPDLGIIYWLKMESIDPEAHLNPDSSDYKVLSARRKLTSRKKRYLFMRGLKLSTWLRTQMSIWGSGRTHWDMQKYSLLCRVKTFMFECNRRCSCASLDFNISTWSYSDKSTVIMLALIKQHWFWTLFMFM